MQRFSQCCFLALSLSLLFTSILFAQSKQPPAQRWEYKEVNSCHLNAPNINVLGDEGWELMSVAIDSGGCRVYVFRRQKPANAPKYDPTQDNPNARKTDPPACNLGIEKAPKFRGIRLGMSSKELLSLFPGSEENPKVKTAFERSAQNYGLVILGFGFTEYQNIKEVKDLFFGVSNFVFKLTDDRLTEYSVVFSEYQPNKSWHWTRNAWEKKLAETFNLPTSERWGQRDWDSSGGNSGLECVGFSITTDAGSKFASFTVTETVSPSHTTRIEQRKKDAIEKVRQEFKINP